MSQWNNTYAYNNHYQGASTWNGDPNAQYMNQAYYPNRQYDPSNQYVSFDEFLSQMQGNNVIPPNTANYNNMQYQNYPVNQYNYQNMPSTSQNTQLDTYGYGANHPNIPNGVEYSLNVQNPYNNMLPDMNSYTNEMVLKSNLTPTATEFVPKSSTVIPSTSSQNIPPTEVSSAHNDVRESRNKYSNSSETNWRERPRNSQQNGNSRNETKEKPESSNHSQENHRSQESIRIRETKNRNQEHRNQETAQRSNDTNHRKYNSNSRSHDSTQNHDSNNRSQEPSSIENNRGHESNRSESNNRGQSKSKSKNKDTDAARTFYNSSIGKGSQDVRNGKGESSGRHRIWGGTQRLRAMDRNSADDEQYANTYLQYKEEKLDKVAKTESTSSPMKSRYKNIPEQGANTEMTQRERLSEQLDKGTLECLVCCERVKQIDQVWSCGNCYHVLHLRCIRKWAMSSMLEGKWRCPACQNTNEDIPTEYRCMCGAVRSPEYQRGVNLAHTCGKACKRSRACPHPCALLCHPGPCPPCQATISKQCGCGAETRSVLCSSKLPQVCTRVCQRKLECGVHYCTKDCHEGPCDKCTEIVTQVCHCPAAKSRSVPCSAETGSYAQWSCGDSCSRVLACGAHVCRRPCHPPPCPPCELLPETVITCPCGKTKLERDKRKSCTDPIPLCENICAKPLPCGPAGDKHFCKMNCHEGPCPVCSDKTLMQCRCGHSSREVPCADLPEMINNVFCQKKCNKKLSCGRHRCRASCCSSKRHRCNVSCGRTLSCQLHRCTEFCHTGHCAPCPRVS